MREAVVVSKLDLHNTLHHRWKERREAVAVSPVKVAPLLLAVSRSSACSGILHSLSIDAVNDLSSLASLSDFSAGMTLMAEGDDPANVVILLKGRIRLSIYSSEGKSLLLQLTQPGEILEVASVLTGRPHRLTAETAEACSCALIHRADFLDFLRRRPEAQLAVAHELGLQYEQACLQLRMIGLTSSGRAKLARLLLEWSVKGQRTELGTCIHIPLTHREIGEALGVARETITRTLSEFHRKRIIQMSREAVTIMDYSALERYAGY